MNLIMEKNKAPRLTIDDKEVRIWGVMFVHLPLQESKKLSEHYVESIYSNCGIRFLNFVGISGVMTGFPHEELEKQMPSGANAIFVYEPTNKFLVIPRYGIFTKQTILKGNGVL